MREKERPLKDKKLFELLEIIGKEPNYSDDKGYEEWQNARDELELRKPFEDIRNAINRLISRVDELEKAVADLLVHKHVDGMITTPIERRIMQ